MTQEMKEWLREMMDPGLLAADDELVEVWDRIDNGGDDADDAPDLVEEGGGETGDRWMADGEVVDGGNIAAPVNFVEANVLEVRCASTGWDGTIMLRHLTEREGAASPSPRCRHSTTSAR